MGAPILWAPGIFAFSLQETLHVHKIPRFRGGGYFGRFGGGGEGVPILFLWAQGFFFGSKVRRRWAFIWAPRCLIPQDGDLKGLQIRSGP